ncbi:MAG: hypothetical protein AB7T49_16535 [Oligoflexales bacterium]
MKRCILALVFLMSACSIGKSDKNVSKIASDEEIISAVQGCYVVEGVEIVNSNFPDHPAITQVLNAKQLCASNFGQLVINATDANGTKVAGDWGVSVSQAQPRCFCYQFEGFDASALFSFEARTADPAAAIELTISHVGLQSTWKFTLGQRS